MDAIIEALRALYDWFASGIYTFFVELVAWVSIKALTWWYYALAWKMTFLWDTGVIMMSNLNVVEEINVAVRALPDNAESLVRYCRIPEALNVIGTAAMARLALRVFS